MEATPDEKNNKVDDVAQMERLNLLCLLVEAKESLIDPRWRTQHPN